jgi:hypothetical protein
LNIAQTTEYLYARSISNDGTYDGMNDINYDAEFDNDQSHLPSSFRVDVTIFDLCESVELE